MGVSSSTMADAAEETQQQNDSQLETSDIEME